MGYGGKEREEDEDEAKVKMVPARLPLAATTKKERERQTSNSRLWQIAPRSINIITLETGQKTVVSRVSAASPRAGTGVNLSFPFVPLPLHKLFLTCLWDTREDRERHVI